MTHLLALFIALFFKTSSLQAKNTDNITVYTEEWAPYNFTDNNKVVGISTELIEAIFKKSSIPYTIKMAPWKRGYAETLTKPNTMLYSTTRTKKRENAFQWVGPLYARKSYLYKLKSREDIKVNSISDLNKYQIGVVRGGSTEEYLLQHGVTNLSALGLDEQAVHILSLGRIDLIPEEDITIRYRILKSNYKPKEMVPAWPLFSSELYLAVHKNTDPKITKALQSALDSLSSENNVRDLLLKKYLE